LQAWRHDFLEHLDGASRCSAGVTYAVSRFRMMIPKMAKAIYGEISRKPGVRQDGGTAGATAATNWCPGSWGGGTYRWHHYILDIEVSVLSWGYPQFSILDWDFPLQTRKFGYPHLYGTPHIYIYTYVYIYIYLFIYKTYNPPIISTSKCSSNHWHLSLPREAPWARRCTSPVDGAETFHQKAPQCADATTPAVRSRW
jgi:hypothetical protein